MSAGGRFDFDDGGTYVGGWEDGKAHGHAVCTGPKGQGEFAGLWQFGFEASGIYMWPSGNSFKGQWTQGKRHGLGVENKGKWIYRGEWTQGFKGRYGVRASTGSGAKYEGTWTTGLQDGYGVETYADGGTYQGQWLRGMRHGYGVRTSVPYGLASHYRPKALRTSLTSLRSENEEEYVVKDRDRKIDESRGGFVLRANSDEVPFGRKGSIFNKHGRSSLRKSLLNGLKLRKQKSTGDIQDSPRRTTGSMRSTYSNISQASADSSHSGITNASALTDSNLSFVSQDDITDVNVTETYMGEWKNDKRAGFGICERSDGLKYEGDWYNNKKHGYGITTFKDGTKEEGKYKNNVLISSGKKSKSKLFLIRTSKLRDGLENAVAQANRAASTAQQKSDTAISRMANARAKAEAADQAADTAERDAELGRAKAKELAPDFEQPGHEFIRRRHAELGSQVDLKHAHENHYPKPPFTRSMTDGGLHVTGNNPPDPGGHSRTQNPTSALVSSALDCAVAGSSSLIVQGLHKLEDDGPAQKPAIQIQRPASGNTFQHQSSRQPNSYQKQLPIPSAYPQTPNSPNTYKKNQAAFTSDSYENNPQNTIQRPSSMAMQHQNSIRPPLRTAPSVDENGTYGGGSLPRNARMPVRAGMSNRAVSPNQMPPQPPLQMARSVSPMLNTSPEPVDHFDQYKTRRDDSGLGRELDSPLDRQYVNPSLSANPNIYGSSSHNHLNPDRLYGPGGHTSPIYGPGGPGFSQSKTLGAHYSDRSPDSGLSDIDDFKNPNRPLQRRLTLPSIMKGVPPDANKTRVQKAAVSTQNKSGTRTNQPSIPNNSSEPERYVIENGIRKRVKAEVYSRPTKAADPIAPPKELPSRYNLVKSSKRGERGSLPDVSVCRELEETLMPRAEVHKLSERRRAELRLMEDEEERRRRQQIVLRIADVKDWCQQRQLLMLVIAVNVSLATMFFNLLSQ